MRFTFIFFFVFIVENMAFAEFNLPNAYTECQKSGLSLLVLNADLPLLPVQPIVKKKLKKSKIFAVKKSKKRPNWDIYWLISSVAGLILYPILLTLFLISLAYQWVLWAGILLVFLLLFYLVLFLLNITLKRNRSDADRFFEKYSILILAGGVVLHSLGTFIIAILLPIFWIWLLALLIFLLSATALFLLLKRFGSK